MSEKFMRADFAAVEAFVTGASSPSISSAAVFPVSRSVQPAVDVNVARRTLVTSGRRCAELYHNSSPLGCCLRMLLTSTGLDSLKWYLTWKPSITKSGRRLKFRLVPSDSTTGARASGFSATPTETANQGCPSMQKWPGCRNLEMTPSAWERRMGFPAGWTDVG